MTTIPPGVRTPLVKAYRPDLFPSNHLQPTEELSELFERILVVGHSDAYDEMTDQTSIELQLAADPEIAFELPGTGGLQVILGGTGSPVTIDAEFGPDTMTVGLEGSVRLQLPTQWLRPVVERDGQWVDDPTRNHVELDLSLGLELDQDWNVSLTTTNEFDIGPAMIGKTGFVVEGTIVADLSETADLDESAALGLDESWRGVVFTQATLYPPESLDVPLVPERIDLVDFHAGTGGVFGTVELTGVTTGELFGFPFELRTLELTFHQSVLTATDIRGRITVPFFDAPMDLELGVAADGTLHAGLSTEDGVKTITHEVCTATIDSVSFDTGGVPSIGIGGMVELNIPDVSLEPVRVDELRIDAEGNTSLQGGWLELPDQYSVDFHGFTFEVTAFGIGRDDDDRKWIGLNGAVSFVDELSAGASVDGLRISWEEDSDGPTDVGLSFDGIGVEFEVPDAVRFAGEVSYSEVTFQEDGREVTEHRFDGAVELDLLALDISIDATLAIGTREEGGREFTFFAVYLGTDLPRGIPLFSTGLALYGVAGLYAGNMRPSKDDEMAWYTADGPSWYHQSPEGVVDFKRKWAASEGSFALGAGVTLGTAADNGFTFSGRLLLVVAFPGPVVMLQGLANLLQERAALSGEEPNFSALAVLDGQAGTLSFGLDAQYRYGETGELADIAASVEAFYNLNDPTAWYIYLGRKEPRDRRVRASMYMGLFEANAYFMLDPRQLAIGAWYGFDESYSFGPLGVDLEAWISGDALVSFFPAHFSAELAAAGGVTLSAFGIRLGVELEAGIGAEVFDPFHLYGAVHVRLNVPWPFEDPTATVRLEWGPEKTPPPLPLPLKEVSVDHQLVTTSWPLPRGAAPDPDSATDPQETYPALLRPNLEADGIIADPDALLAGPADPDPEQEAAPPDRLPVVPLDGRPQVTFTRPVHDDGGVGFNPQPVVPKRETIGDPGANEGPADVRYALSDVRLERFDAATTDWVDVPDVYGAWAPMPALPEGIGITGADPSMANTKLWIRSRNPFDYVRHTGGSYTETVHRRYRDYPCGTATDCYAYDGLTTDDFDVAEEPLLEGQPIHATTARRRYDADWPVVAHLWFAWPPDDSVPFPRPADYRPRVVDHTYSTADGSVSRPVFEFQPVAEEAARNFAVGPRGLLHLFFVTLPEPRRSVRLSFVGAKGINAAMLMGTDDRGVQRRAGRLAVDPETETTLTITSPGGRFERVGLLIHGWSNAATTALGTVRLVETCVADADLEDLGRTEVDQVEHLREGLARWSDEAPVFAPWTTYRLVVETTVDAVGRGEFDWFERRGWLREYAYFRTEAPPGLGRLSTPIGTPDPDQHESGLEDLRPYVNATVPATRPPAGERPSLPRPVYRAYDVGVAFGRTYVDLLYRSVGHDLAVTLFDSNNRPARDAAGRLIIDANPWDVVESLTLDRDDGTWLRTVSRAGCVPVDESTVRHADRLQATVGVLAPDTVYEARLVPRLLREGFADEAYHIAGTTMSAPTAWQTVDEGFAGDWHVAGHPPLQGRQATVAGQVVTLGDAAGALDDVAAGVDSIRLRRTAHDPDAIRDGKTYEIAAVDATAGTVTVEGTPTLDGESAWSIPGRGHVRQSATPSGSTSDAPTSLHVVSATRGGGD